MGLKFGQEIIDKIRGKKENIPEEEKNFFGSKCKTCEELLENAEKIPYFDTRNCEKSQANWHSNLNELKDNILNSDTSAFLSWNVVLRTMFIKYADYIKVELNYLKNNENWNKKYRNAIKEDILGMPYPCPLYPASSSNLIHHMYHIAVFEEKTNFDVENFDFVFEFGGGYGSMARLFQNLNYKGKYLIYDLPLFSSLQKFYLKTLGFKELTVENFKSEKTGFLCISDLDILLNILKDTEENKNNLFLATWSFSECPVSLREKIKPFLEKFNKHLIAYQVTFGEALNTDYFKEYRQFFPNLIWEDSEIKHLNGSRYLIGAKNEI